MPWNTDDTMTQRMKFVLEWLDGSESRAELCRRHGISRGCGYKWMERFRQHGGEGLVDRSRAPHQHPNRTPADAVERVIALRRAHADWGAGKLRTMLLERHPGKFCPSATVIGEILRDEGLTRAQKKRRRTPPHSQPLAHAAEPNDVVSLDFKGWFRTADGERIEPLTVFDNASRYLLYCQALKACDTASVRAALDRVFRDYGLPKRIRSDNGAPFASRALGGLSALSVWWIKLGIEVERIEPGKPAQNGRQERFHRTLKQRTASPPRATRRAQQRAFREFQHEYNCERPHQALAYRTPESVYEASPRSYPRPLLEMEYAGWPSRKVDSNGSIYWRGGRVFVSEILYGERVGLEAIEEGLYRVWFGSLELGEYDERRGKIAPVPRRRGTGPCGARPVAAADAATLSVEETAP